MISLRRHSMHALWSAAGVAVAGSVALAAFYAPVEASMGPVQKIFYLHLPAALCMFGACIGVFVGNIGYAWQRSDRWDALALACAEVAMALSAVVLITGMIWGRFAWGQWWTWSPRLTFSLILWLLYVAYLILHQAVSASPRRGLICAMYGIVAFMDVPLVYLSTTLLPDIHPSDVHLEPRMRVTLLVCVGAMALVCTGIVHARYVRARQHAMPDAPEGGVAVL